MPGSISHCPICGDPMPLSQLPAHGRAAHPEVFNIVRKAKRDYNRRFAMVAGPTLAVWYVLTVLGLSYGWLLGWPAWSVVAVLFGGFLLIPLATYAYAVRAYRADLRRAGDRPHPCGFCGIDVAGSEEQEQHLKAVHPEVRRLTRFGRTVEHTTDLAYGVGVFVLLAAIVADWIPFVLWVVALALMTCVLFLASFWVRASVTRKVMAMRR